MEENKFAPPAELMASPELVEQLKRSDAATGVRAGKVVMAGLPSPDFDAYREAAKRLFDQAANESLQETVEGPKKPTQLNRKQRRAAAKKALQDRKKKKPGDPEPQTQYVCDPSKNVHCKKTHCHLNGGPCHHTTKLECAKQPVEKARMVIPVSGKERADFIKQYAKELKDL